ncbi:MAG: cytochrome c biogenesis protein CcsA [Polyangiales bacterium]
MSGLVFLITALLYAASCIAYVVVLARGSERAARTAKRLGLAAILGHAGLLLAHLSEFIEDGGRNFQVWLSLLAFGAAVTFMIASARRSVEILGAFVMPWVLLLFVASSVGQRYAPVSDSVHSALLAVHIGSNISGLVAFSIAFAAAVAYLIEERLLRQRKLTGVFQRLPSLDVLDRLNHRRCACGISSVVAWIDHGHGLDPSVEPNANAFAHHHFCRGDVANFRGRAVVSRSDRLARKACGDGNHRRVFGRHRGARRVFASCRRRLMWDLFVIGMSHHDAPIQTRERLAVSPNEMLDSLWQLAQHQVLHETLLISTCNRVEVFASTDSPIAASQIVRDFFRDRGADEHALQSMHHLEGQSAVGTRFA